jgi:hypothetical protein
MRLVRRQKWAVVPVCAFLAALVAPALVVAAVATVAAIWVRFQVTPIYDARVPLGLRRMRVYGQTIEGHFQVPRWIGNIETGVTEHAGRTKGLARRSRRYKLAASSRSAGGGLYAWDDKP